ncbi:MAG: HIT family hydrolase [Hydrogenibacillus schlegelii]|uniref:HIT family hydrolase n=1 Tax=Hydrogenibacillus schlegelii TaxID=1484 RepID=A0A2T5GE25_HYDSH|nr:histidine triad nucleotide-binding protein [Hydrogenibacillus schlegelii]PTQ54429.1 MAG: HIT family hydrolase [Hydrogenibacillus schlegelii]
MHEENCVFCKIIRGELSSKKVYEDDETLAFHDINPIAPVHVLVVPKRHISSVMALTDDDAALIGRIHRTIREVATVTGVAETGFRVITNTGPHGQQTVFHLHYHVIGGRQLSWTM